MSVEAPKHHSKHGGLWIDRDDWHGALGARLADGRVDQLLAERIATFVERGFVVLENAAPLDAIAEFEAAITDAFVNGSDSLLAQASGDSTNRHIAPGAERRGTRIVDSFARLPAALRLFASEPLIAFLRGIFDADPLLFQSLSFHLGSEQGLHQDTAYVVVDRPLELAACWIALEDVQPGSGELMYVPGSHRFPDFDFGGDKKHWNAQADGFDVHHRWARWLHEEAAARGLATETFLARKGDILVWHADLAHGGSPVLRPETTRRSLVGHFCPSDANPNYFSYRADRRTVRRFGPLAYASEHFAL